MGAKNTLHYNRETDRLNDCAEDPTWSMWELERMKQEGATKEEVSFYLDVRDLKARIQERSEFGRWFRIWMFSWRQNITLIQTEKRVRSQNLVLGFGLGCAVAILFMFILGGFNLQKRKSADPSSSKSNVVQEKAVRAPLMIANNAIENSVSNAQKTILDVQTHPNVNLEKPQRVKIREVKRVKNKNAPNIIDVRWMKES